MTSSVIFSGLPIGNAPTLLDSFATPMLAAPPDTTATPPMDKGVEIAADTARPDIEMECAALPLALLPAFGALPIVCPASSTAKTETFCKTHKTATASNLNLNISILSVINRKATALYTKVIC